jgi:hypothetical protein
MSALFSAIWTQSRAAAARTVLNADHVVRLFTNDIAVSPATVTTDFAEANFDTYAEQALTGLVAVPTFVEAGRYRLTVGPFDYLVPLVAGNVLRGWYVVNTVSAVTVCCQKWTSPISFTPSSLPLRLTLKLDFSSVST